ncbi:MAG: DNA cytosine methyltransferase [Acidimicrobiia bacterium]
MSTGLVTIDLFAGAGGLSLGLRRAGFDVVLAVERDADSCKTFLGHHPGVDLRDGDIVEVDFVPFSGQVDVVVGGPPCQPFSTGGKGLANEDPRDATPEFARAIRQVRPRAFLMENVPGLVHRSHRTYFDKLSGSLQDLGFELNWQVLDASDFGAPQKRRRLFLVGIREKAFVFPSPTHASSPHRGKVPASTVVTAERIIGEPNPSIVTYARAPDLRPSPYDGHLWNGGGRPIDLTRPSPTVLAAAGGNKTHWIDTELVVPAYHRHLVTGGKPREGRVPGARRLTVEESALLQTFPSSVVFEGSRSSRYTQVGNAVPPVVAEVLGEALRDQLSP